MAERKRKRRPTKAGDVEVTVRWKSSFPQSSGGSMLPPMILFALKHAHDQARKGMQSNWPELKDGETFTLQFALTTDVHAPDLVTVWHSMSADEKERTLQ